MMILRNGLLTKPRRRTSPRKLTHNNNSNSNNNNTNNNNNDEDAIFISSGIRRRYYCSHPSSFAASSTSELKESSCFKRRVHHCHNNRRHSSHTAIAANDNSASHSEIPSPNSTTTTRVLFPTLGQNGTLLLRSTSNSRIDQVQIISQWRDDTLLEVVPISSSSYMHSEIDTAVDADAEGIDDIAIFDNDNSTSSFGRLQLENYEDGITTSLGRKGAMVKVNILNNATSKSKEEDHSNCNNAPVKIMVTVPEKFNFDCRLANGDIIVDGKLEGDVHLATEDGDITVSKLRGHNVTLDTTTNTSDDAIRDDDATNNNDDVSIDDRVATESMTTTTTTALADSGMLHKGVIHVRKAIEARTVRIHTPSRVRARMLNGSNVSVHVVSRTSSKSKSTGGAEGVKKKKLDDDDEGAIIDVGSLYISNGGGLEEGGMENEARLIVDDDTNPCSSYGNNNISDSSGTTARSSGLVRVKSTHGHVTVHAKSNHSSPSTSSSEEEPLSSSLQSPLIDLGGVNGSCDVTLEISSSCNVDTTNNDNNTPFSNTNCNKITTTRIHFDSMTPESISTITTRGGGRGQHAAATSITVDRKVEAEVRLLSVNMATSSSSGTHLLPPNVDAYSITSDDDEDVKSILMEVNDFVRKHNGDDVNGYSREGHDDVVVTTADDKKRSSISIETDAYNGEWGWNALDSQCNNGDDNDNAADANNDNCPELSRAIEYTRGTMRNRSEEPDSRFDVRSRGGKINIDGAASQALHGFRGKTKEGDPPSSSSGTSDDASSTSPPLPLLAVATEGEIKLETLSWFGSIARRYGLGEEGGKKENRGIGRQASRKPRLDS
mmetsp:Transcript_32110/g.61520  ORF Transcript_32110/g.61520 Transcript_32110/m.61520 type:complete len:832 (+) Transcript_32110:214-2709(+)